MRAILISLELLLLSALIIFPRLANHHEVFVNGNIYFTDTDCYSRMTRARICFEHPGTILRHHEFENYPAGITPHTTAPFDYLIVAFAKILQPFTRNALDLAGAFISPLIALFSGFFLWWWLRRMQFRHRWTALILFAVSPILVHGTELGRPDHQSLLILLVLVAVCAMWRPGEEESIRWNVASAAAWAMALWVSLYEPAILFLASLVILLLLGRAALLVEARTRAGWLCFGGILLFALCVERRLPRATGFVDDTFVRSWARSIGELQPVSWLSGAWWGWCGWLLLLLPLLLYWQRRNWLGRNGRCDVRWMLALIGLTFALTLWQARWSYFFVLLFLVILPFMLESIRSRAVVWIAFALSLWPVAKEWETRLWPNENLAATRLERRGEAQDLRRLAEAMISDRAEPFLAPWWLSAAIAYWSGQPGIAGSSHEGIAGIVDSARFYAATDVSEAEGIIEIHKAEFVLSYDADRVALNASGILGRPVSEHALCYVLDRAPALSPTFLVLEVQSPTGKLFQVANKR